MARSKYAERRTIPHRRKREARTNFKKRLALLKSESNRLVIRKALNTITAQIIAYNPDGDKVLAAATSKELAKLGWKMHTSNMPSAYLTGMLLGVRAKKKKLTEAVLDLGLHIPNKGGKLFAALKGAVDAGLQVNHDAAALPSQDRISGKHISEYAKGLKKDSQRYNKQFSRCIKSGANPEDMIKAFDETKKKILAS
jgi:large subunit ribosomal protein L18